MLRLLPVNLAKDRRINSVFQIHARSGAKCARLQRVCRRSPPSDCDRLPGDGAPGADYQCKNRYKTIVKCLFDHAAGSTYYCNNANNGSTIGLAVPNSTYRYIYDPYFLCETLLAIWQHLSRVIDSLPHQPANTTQHQYITTEAPGL